MYKSFLLPIFFRFDPEQTHDMAMTIAKGLCHYPAILDRLSSVFHYEHPYLRQNVMGIEFRNPLGLAAGFDKNAEAIPLWQTLGFGFAEVGTITPLPQPGNPQPRLFRLVQDQAILNRMGFNNDGAETIAGRILSQNNNDRSFVVGINLGKQKETPIDQAHGDYLHSFRLLKDKGDYFVINVSSPNTPNLRDLQAVSHLDRILSCLQAENEQHKPILVKIAPDLKDEDILAIVDLCLNHSVSGIIATNTTISRDHVQTTVLSNGKRPEEEPGGISGAPLKNRSSHIIRLIWRHSLGKIPIVGVGGISSAADAWEKLTAGASLLQVYTGLIYQGPGLITEILRGITARMEQHNFTNLRQVIGSQLE
ncbi:MAG: dihydroorotate dehydrogenase (quinone) [Cyanobacteria bacterium M5B4]|nr:MAG: dihydroorotate dehydrogenase (quinone) [Cyanobacteria bacterium M5B4]